MLELNPSAPSSGDLIKDGTDQSFMSDVVEASQKTPVLVDFWAPWCGPCKQLTPAIEQAVRDAGGKVKLVKINVDENPGVAGQLRVQSVPTVYAFSGGQPVDGFMGAKPSGEIKQFIDKLLAGAGPAPGVQEALDMAAEALETGGAAQAAQIYAQILSAEPENLTALAGLAKCYLALGELEQAEGVLQTVPEDKEANPEIAAVLSQISLLRASAAVSGDAAALKATMEANPGDLQAHYDYATALIGVGQNEEAVDCLLALFQKDREWNEEAAKRQLFTLIESLGPEEPLAQKARRRFGSLVFA